ncbi:ABC transporter permease, partial [Microbacterium testaceum]
ILGFSLIDTWWAVWLPAGATAFNVLIIARFLEAIPADLYEAARIDGAGPLRILWSIVLPLARPILGVVGLLTVVASWKDYLWPLLVLPTPDNQPVSVALPRLADQTELSVQMAALFLSLIIPVALFLIFQRQFLRGASMAGGVKG